VPGTRRLRGIMRKSQGSPTTQALPVTEERPT